MPPTIRLPLRDGRLAPYAAAHVVCDPLADRDPLSDARLDWEATLAYRGHLWSLGLAVADAMDTAQRGTGLGWNAARELIRRSVAEAQARGGVIACGAGTDQLAPAEGVTLSDVQRAYEEQVGFVEGQGGGARVILMASRALARAARGPDDYARVYGAILRQVARPVILHWLGDMFDPQLAGYWGTRDVDEAMDACLAIICEHRAKIDGIKISLLDVEREAALHVEQRDLDPVDLGAVLADDREAGVHGLVDIARAPVAGELRVEHVAEPVQDDGAAHLPQHGPIDPSVVVGPARRARQGPARHQDDPSPLLFHVADLLFVRALHVGQG